MLMNRRLNVVLLLLGFLAWNKASAQESPPQKIEVTPFYGYQVGGDIRTRGGNAGVKGATVYGLAVDVFVNPEWQFEAFYSRQDTDLNVRDDSPFGSTSEVFDVSVEYFQGGFLYQFDDQKSVRPFLLISLGATRFDPKQADLSSEWSFSIVGGGGVKLFVSDHFGFRFQGQLQVPFLWIHSRFFCSAPGGCLLDIDAAATLQAAGSVGIILAF
jgi:hypothetical protein